MKTIQFKTNIKCDGCIAKVTPILDNEKNIDKWGVDLTDPERTLTITGNEVSLNRIQSILQIIGYKAEPK